MFRRKYISVIELNDRTGGARYLKGRQEGAGVSLLACEETDSAAGLAGIAKKYGAAKTTIVLLLPRHLAFIRKVTVPSGSDTSEIRKMLQFEAAKHLPYPVEEAAVDFSPVSANEILLLAVKKDIIRRQSSQLETAGIFADKVLLRPTALSEVFKLPESDKGDGMLIDVNRAFWGIDFYINGRVILSRGSIVREDDYRMVKEEALKTIAAFKSSNREFSSNVLHFAGDADFDEMGTLFDNTGFCLPKLELSKPVAAAPGVEIKDIAAISGMVGAVIAAGKEENLLPKEALSVKRNKFRNKAALKVLAAALIIAAAVLSIFVYKNKSEMNENRKARQVIRNSRMEIAALEKRNSLLEKIDVYMSDSSLPLAALNELSRLLPANVFVTQYQYDGEQGLVALKCRTNAFDTAARSAESLSKSKLFVSVNNKGARAVKFENKNLVDFELECSLRK